MAKRNTMLTCCRSRLATSSAPRASAIRSAARISGGSISSIRRLPSAGKMSRSSRDSTRSAWDFTQRAFIVSCQRRAIVSNRRSFGTTAFPVGAFGSSPSASRRRPSSRFARASARPISG